MTDDLKDLLADRAAATEPPPLDLATITTSGARRIRRRRTGTVLASGLLTMAAVAAGLTAVHSVNGSSDPAGQPGPFAERRVTYALQDTIHYGSERFSVGTGKQIRQFVQTDHAFVYQLTGDRVLDDQGMPVPGAPRKLYLLDRNGSAVLPMGTLANDRGVISDDRSNLVGWEENDPAEQSKLGDKVVYDTATRREVLRVPSSARSIPGIPGSPPVGTIQAIDQQKVYFLSPRGVYEVDITTMRGRDVAFSGVPVYDKVHVGGLVIDVEDSRYLYLAWLRDKTSPLFTGPDLAKPNGRALQVPADYEQSTRGTFAPGGEFVSIAHKATTALDESSLLFDARSGRRLQLNAPGYESWRFGQWLDRESFTAAGIKNIESSPDLLRCSARTLHCEVVKQSFAPSFRAPKPDRVTFPTGRFDM